VTTWLPNLVGSVAIWHLAADLNRPSLMGGRLLVPELDGPASLPTSVRWHVGDYLPLEEARRTYPEDVDIAIEAFRGALRKLDAELESSTSGFARFRVAFSVPDLSAEGCYFFDPKGKELRVANWGATPRSQGARSIAVHTAARFPQAERRRGASAASGAAGDGVAGTSTAQRRGPRAMALTALLLLLAIGAFVYFRTARTAAPEAGSVPSRPTALPSPPTSAPPPDRDGDGVADGDDVCVEVPGRDHGCPTAEHGITVTQDRIATGDRILFATGSARIEAESAPILDALAALLRNNPDISEVLIEGHADRVGDADKNFVLSTARALAVRKALVERHVEESRLRVDAHGADAPRRATDAGALENRRVEFRITRVKDRAL
jgi:outer membrane protein OmpA-like peptidoglycan-associated protein